MRKQCAWIIAAVFATYAAAQTPQKAVDEYLRASGGAKAIAGIQNSTLAGSLREETTGKTGSFSLITKAPNRFYLEIIAGGDRTAEAYNGMSAWRQDPSEGVRSLSGKVALETEASARYWNSRLADLKKAKIALESVAAGRVRVQVAPGITRDVQLDSGSHLIARLTSAAMEWEFGDYRAVKGIQTPHRVQLSTGGRKFEIAITRAEYNSTVEDAVFDFPRTSTAPLPDMKALILEVSRNQEAIDEMRKQYTCHLSSEDQKVDGKGKVVSTSTKEFELFFVGGEEVKRLLAKDGKPLDAGERKKEDERFNKDFEKLQKEAAKRATDPKKKEKEAKEEAQISDFLRAVKFSNARRERFRGQEVIAVDFGPNPEYKPKKAIEGIVQKLAGVVWIDEKARDVVRLEAHFNKSAKIAAGVLASLDEGSSLVFEEAKVNDEVWLPTYTEVHMSGRVLVVKLKAHEIDRYSDYKKFSTESKIVGVGQVK